MDEQPPPAHAPSPPAKALRVFGPSMRAAEQFVERLADVGVPHGLIGPREIDRLWDRHLMNSAVIGEHIPQGARVVDLGSGAGFPGVPLALARPDLTVTLLESMARRVSWLTEIVRLLDLDVSVLRGRAEDPTVKNEISGADVVTARAVAPLARLWAWSAPLIRTGGLLVAIKGANAQAEIDRDAAAVRRAGGDMPILAQCGGSVLEPPTTTVLVRRRDASGGARTGKRRGGTRRRAER